MQNVFSSKSIDLGHTGIPANGCRKLAEVTANFTNSQGSNYHNIPQSELHSKSHEDRLRVHRKPRKCEDKSLVTATQNVRRVVGLFTLTRVEIGLVQTHTPRLEIHGSLGVVLPKMALHPCKPHHKSKARDKTFGRHL